MNSKIKKLARVTGISGTTVVALVLVGSLVAQAIAPLVIGAAYGGMVLGAVITTALTDAPDTTGLSATEAELEVYQTGLQIQSRADSYLTVRENYNNDTKQIAYGIVQAEIAESLKNNETEAVAASEAKAAVDEYYSVHQYNNINEWNAEWESVNATGHTLLDADGTDDYTMAMRYSNDGATNLQKWTSATFIEYENVTLLNGTSIQRVSHVYNLEAVTASLTASEGGGANNPWNAAIKDPSDSALTNVTSVSRWESVFAQPDTKATEVKSGVDQYAADVYAAYSAGDLDGVSIVDPTVAAGQMPDDGSSALTFIAYAAASSGHTTSAQLNVNVTDEVSGNTYDAVYFTSAVPTTTYDFGDGSEPAWLVGNTYDAADYSEPVYIAYVDGNETTVAELDGNYTINSATSLKTGEPVDAIRAAVDAKQKTYNASTFVDELQQAEQSQQEYDETNSNGAGGASEECSKSFSSFCLDDIVDIGKWALIGIAGIYLLQILGIVGPILQTIVEGLFGRRD